MTHPATYIHWRDASYNPEESTEFGLADLHEVGFVVAEDHESVTLSMEHMDGEVSHRLTLTIPLVNILERRDFKIPRRRKSGT